MALTPRLHISQRGLALLKSFEGGPDGSFAPRQYRCPAGVSTIGWGHAVRKHEVFDEPLSDAGAEALLIQDVGTTELYLNATVRSALLQHEFDALVLLTFNIGLGAYEASRGIRPAVNCGDRKAIALHIMDWVFVGKVRADGLVIRRTCESMLFQGNTDQQIATARSRLQQLARVGSL
ncbi:MAG: lysozyme [Rhodocyclales bacterium]|nr:lysozyme [Rhodocyclales bacterium]